MMAIHGVKDDLKAEITAVHTEIQEARGDFKREITELYQRVESDIAELRSDTQKEVQKLREEVERLEFHQRKYNLIFSGMKVKREGEEKAVTKLCTETLGLQAPALVNAHLIGKQGDVIARFQRWEDRQAILNNAKKLKGLEIGIKTDLPAALSKKRSQLLERRKQLKAQGVIVRVVERAGDVLLQTKTSARGEWKTGE